MYGYCQYENQDILQAAEDKINALTFNRIVGAGFESLTSFQRELVRRACLYQCEYYEKYGVDAEGMESISVEDFSASYAKGSAAAMGVDSRTLNCLVQTGLMCRRL